MNKFSKLAAVFVIFLAITSISFAAEKVVLLEQFTGAWCGYCPDGSLIMDQIIKDNPGKVIGVKIHNAYGGVMSYDSMAIPEEQILSQALGNSGYPSGMVDRSVFNVGGSSAIFLSRNIWSGAVDAILQQNTISPVGLKLDWYYDEDSQMIYATIEGDFEQTISDELRFNVYVLEDSIPAIGTGYAQANYYDDEASSPLYKKGNPMKDYYHMKVVRKMMGGAWGQEYSIPTPVTAGSKIFYTFAVPKNPKWKMKDIHLIGMVQYATSTNKQIVTAVEGIEKTPKTTYQFTPNALFAGPTGYTKTNEIKIKNTSTLPIQYEVKINSTNPEWNISINPNETEFTLQPGSSKTLTILYTVGSAGVSTGLISINEVDGSGFATSLKGYNSEPEFLQVNNSANDYGVLSTIQSFDDYKNIAPIPADDFVQVSSEFENLVVAYWCMGENGTLSANQKSTIDALLNKKVHILFSGPLTFSSMHSNMPTVESQLGFSYIASEFSGYNTGAINLAGIDGDPISSGFSSLAQLTYYLPQKARITNTSIASPVLTITGQKDTILAVRSELSSGVRIAAFSFNVAKISNETQKNNLMKNTLNWLVGIQSTAPRITVSATTVDFGDIETDSSAQKTITIQNTGTADLTIISATLTSNADNSFSIIQPPASTIAPGGSSDVIIGFAPQDKKLYISPKLEIVSNDPNTATVTVRLNGRGVEPVGISRDILGYFNVTPNVVSDAANINFAISSPVPQNVKIYLMDLSGRKIADIQDGVYSYGEYKLSLSTTNLNSGAYFVVAEIGKDIETIRINVVK